MRLAEIEAFFASALISPVLTAHPTEVQRKSLLDTERTISALLSRKSLHLPRHESERNDRMLYAAVTLLWQTRMLRFSRLTVNDEIDNALSYYRMSLLDSIPELLQDLELEISHGFGKAGRTTTCPSSSRWGAGSAATATATPTSTPPRCAHALSARPRSRSTITCAEVHALGTRTVDVDALVAGHRRDAGAGRTLARRPERIAATSPTAAR